LNNAIIENLPQNYALNEVQFNELVAKSRAKVGDITLVVVNTLVNIAKYYTGVRRRLDDHSLADVINLQLEELLYPQFLAYSKWQFLQQYPRYLQAILIRLDKYVKNQIRDSQFEQEINQLYDKWYNYVDSLEQRNKILMSEMHDFRYKIEELRVSLFAQEIKTLYPVSLKRLLAELESIYLKNLS
jgi:ATP-dependent helicase HrpA